MASLRHSDRLLRYSRFSLRSLLVGLTLASLAFAGWWQRPVQIDHMTPELVKVSGDGCLHSIIQTALWLEVSPPPTDRLEALLWTSQNNGTYGTSHSFDEFITLECEANHCHLVLRGDTLYLEPR